MYRLLCYQPHNIHASSSGYVPPRLVKPLRTGAEDEVIMLPQAPAPLSVRTSMSVDAMVAEDVQTMAEAQVEEKEKESPREIVQPVVVSTLKPPEALFKPIDYPPLHIMVSVLVLVLEALSRSISYPLCTSWSVTHLHPLCLVLYLCWSMR